MDKKQIVLIVVVIISILLFNKLDLFEEEQIVVEDLSFTVSVDGAVKEEGTYQFSELTTIEEVIIKAGGLLDNADTSDLEFDKIIDKDYLITIPYIEEELIKVYISGEVYYPGVYELSQVTYLEELIRLAGGFTVNAKRDINLAKILKDGEEIIIEKEIIEEEITKIYVEIKGEVLYPGLYELDNNSIVNDLILKAGGFTKRANSSNINLARKLKDEELIIVQKEKVTINNDLININHASKEELESLTGIGDVLSSRIIEYRKNKMFSNIEELLEIEGISLSKYEKIKNHITV